jgi:hypothetical protein
MAGKNWLKELIPFFRSENTGAVGGHIEGYYKDKALDRYEDACSSLNMGKRLQIEGNTASGLYVPPPTCSSPGGVHRRGRIRRERHIGEDVDFCWRMRKLGYTLIYAPMGSVAHKHRSILCKMLARRSYVRQFGSHALPFPQGQAQDFPRIMVFRLILSGDTGKHTVPNPWSVAAIPLLFAVYLCLKFRILHQRKVSLPPGQVCLSVNTQSYFLLLFRVFSSCAVLSHINPGAGLSPAHRVDSGRHSDTLYLNHGLQHKKTAPELPCFPVVLHSGASGISNRRLPGMSAMEILRGLSITFKQM